MKGITAEKHAAGKARYTNARCERVKCREGVRVSKRPNMLVEMVEVREGKSRA